MKHSIPPSVYVSGRYPLLSSFKVYIARLDDAEARMVPSYASRIESIQRRPGVNVDDYGREMNGIPNLKLMRSPFNE